MFPSRRHVFVAVLGGACALAPASALELPPIDGSLGGRINVRVLPGAPELEWRLVARTPEPGERTMEIELSGTGTRLAANATLNAATGAGAWTLTTAEFLAAAWLPVFAAQLGVDGDAVKAGGVIEVAGGGEIRGGDSTGRLSLGWRDGRMENADEGWVLDGVGFRGDFLVSAADVSVRSDGPFELTVDTITTRRFGARNLVVRAVLENASTLLVREARIEIAGGDVALDPFTLPLSPLRLDVTLRLTRVGLQDLAALVPEALAEASGRVDGVVGLRWSDADGLRIGAGHLAVRKDEPAQVRLAPTPGLISASLPDTVLEYYPGLSQIETGVVPLRADRLEVTLTPDGDEDGRTAHVQLEGGPVDPRLRAPIHLTVNVRGPLESLIKLGTSARLQFGNP